MRQDTKQNKRKQNHKVELSFFFFILFILFYFILTTEKIKMVRMEADLHYFPMLPKD